MDNREFLNICIDQVVKFTNEHMSTSEEVKITSKDVYVVWSCKTLQNNKALLSSTLSNGMYYECTYNGDKKELYFDAYKKLVNTCINL